MIIFIGLHQFPSGNCPNSNNNHLISADLGCSQLKCLLKCLLKCRLKLVVMPVEFDWSRLKCRLQSIEVSSGTGQSRLKSVQVPVTIGWNAGYSKLKSVEVGSGTGYSRLKSVEVGSGTGYSRLKSVEVSVGVDWSAVDEIFYAINPGSSNSPRHPASEGTLPCYQVHPIYSPIHLLSYRQRLTKKTREIKNTFVQMWLPYNTPIKTGPWISACLVAKCLSRSLEEATRWRC